MDACGASARPVQPGRVVREKVWSEPMRVLAQQYGVSDVYVARVCSAAADTVTGSRLLGKEKRRRPTKKCPPLLPLPWTESRRGRI